MFKLFKKKINQKKDETIIVNENRKKKGCCSKLFNILVQIVQKRFFRFESKKNVDLIKSKQKGFESKMGDEDVIDTCSLSEEDQIECKFEIVDMLHFFMNYAASIGMTSQEMYNFYMSKNKENRARQKNGY